MASPKWEDLPPELLMKVANSCPGIQKLMRGACKTWKIGLEATCSQLTITSSALPPDVGSRFTALAKLDLQGCAPGVTPRGLRHLRALPSLTSLALKLVASELTGEMLGALRGLPLAILTLGVCAADLTDALGGTLRALNLARLDLVLTGERNLFVDAHLQRLAGLPITELDLSETRLSDSDLAALRDLSLLASLDLSDIASGTLSNAGLAQLRGIPLTALKIGDWDDVTDEGLDALRWMPLTSLALVGLSVTGEGLEVLRGMSLSSLNLAGSVRILNVAGLRGLPLTSLNLDGLPRLLNESFDVVQDMCLRDLTLFCSVRDASLEVLRGKPLTRLDLGFNPKVTGVGLEVLEDMPLADLRASGIPALRGESLYGAPLKHLEVDKFTDSDMNALAGKELVHLELWGSEEVADMGLKVLQGMNSLTHLSIHKGHQITDAGLEFLRGLPLEKVTINNCREVTDIGLDVVLGMPLRYLAVTFCPKTTRQGVTRVAGSAAVTFFPE